MRLIGPIILLFLVAGCAAGAEAPADDRPIARIGNVWLSADSFREYLVEQFGAPSDLPEGDDDLLSRLLDQYLEEQILLAKARQRDLQVEEAEVERFLRSRSPYLEAAGGADRERFLRNIRASLLTEKLKEGVIAERVEVSDEEIESFYRTNAARFHRPTVVHLRQILVDEQEQAERLHRELAAAPGRFQDLAEKHSVAPDKGLTGSYEEADLPEKIRTALAGLGEGELSPVVQDSQGFHLFQVVGRERAQEMALSDVHREIEQTLFREKSEQVLAGYLAELRAEFPVEILRENLAFRYEEND